ncbi:MAG: GntR family transcriptional regulator [Eubacteriales bacterium]|nr:GntR family transcriptional regulator [Eubacteriales bacterium]
MDLSSYTKPQKESLSDKIHDEILEMIIQTPQQEGIVLNERQLVEVFGVSKAPIREALVRLCSEGVLKNIPRFGYVVIQINPKEAEDVVKMRLLLETEALKAGFADIVEYHLDDIRRQIDAFWEIAKNGVTILKNWENNEEFHLLLASYANSKILSRFLAESLHIQKRYFAQNQWFLEKQLNMQIPSPPHLAIWDALRDGDLERSIRVLQEDIKAPNS